MPYQRQQKSVWDMILTSVYIGIRAGWVFIDEKTRRKEENSLLCDHSPSPSLNFHKTPGLFSRLNF